MTLQKDRLNSGELAKLAGVSTDTLRHYERKGVLARPKRGSNGYRQYPATALSRVRLIRRALAVGFTLDELANILRVRDGGGAPCHEVRALAAVKLSHIEAQLKDLTAMRNDLKRTLEDWDERLKKTRPKEPAHLLESLASNSRGGTRSRLNKQSPLKQQARKEKLK